MLSPNEQAVIRILYLQARDLQAALIYARTPRQDYDALAGDMLDEAIVQGLHAQRFEIRRTHAQHLYEVGQQAELLRGIGAQTCLEMEVHFGPLGDWEDMSHRMRVGQEFYRYQRHTTCAILETSLPAAQATELVAGCLCYVPYQQLTDDLMATFRPITWAGKAVLEGTQVQHQQ